MAKQQVARSEVILLYMVDDGSEWADYIGNVFASVHVIVVRLEMDSEGRISRAGIRGIRQASSPATAALVLLATPGFLRTLLINPSVRFDELMPQETPGETATDGGAARACSKTTATSSSSSSRSVLFFCGTNKADLEEMDSAGCQLMSRFPDVDRWTVVDHENHGDILPQCVRRLVDEHRRQRRLQKPFKNVDFKIVPTELKSEVCT